MDVVVVVLGLVEEAKTMVERMHRLLVSPMVVSVKVVEWTPGVAVHEEQELFRDKSSHMGSWHGETMTGLPERLPCRGQGQDVTGG